MTVRRLLAPLLALLVLAAACGEPRRFINDVRRAISKTQSGPHEYRYTEEAAGHEAEVVVSVEDSFRSSASLSLNGVPLLEQVVVDDAVALRLPSPGRWNPAANTPLESLLGSGRWVIDPAGAPPVLFASEAEGDVTDVGTDLIGDAINAFDYALASATGARDVIKFNRESLDYFPADDPFRSFVEEDEDAGITRFDAIPPVLPRTNEGQRGPDALPTERTFRKLSVFIQDGRLVRILEQIDFESHRDLKKAQEEGKPRFLLDVLEGLRRGIGEDPIRSRKMSVEITSREADVKLPSDGVQANIGELLESEALTKLPDPDKLERKPKPSPPA